MSGQRSRWVLVALLLMPAAGHSANVTIYRCTDERGRLTLRDSPCPKGERQEARTMVRPKDPPARARAVPDAIPTPTSPRAPGAARVVVVTAPQTLYECVTWDGSRYLSESERGESNWQPLWSYGYPLLPDARRHSGRGRGGFAVVAEPRTVQGSASSGLMFDSVGRPTPKLPAGRPPLPAQPLPPGRGGGFAGFYSSGGWVEDYCQPLPHVEVCARLRDRRYELDRRYNSALQGERTQISLEQRGIDARLASDCGGY